MKKTIANDFSEQKIHSLADFRKLCEGLGNEWVFRGQSSDWQLKTCFERTCADFDIALGKAPKIEKKLIREFRRQYDGADHEIVMTDTLYCLSLMQHHGAPTRLLDWTYSPYVAAYFALESTRTPNVIWCLNMEWCGKAVQAIVGKHTLDDRNNDESRNDKTFMRLFMPKRPRKFVFLDNPFSLHKRLIIQQGIFLIPGDISVPFSDNMKALKEWQNPNSVRAIKFEMTNQMRLNALDELHRMNIDRASLFPGLEGFSRHLGKRLHFYASQN